MAKKQYALVTCWINGREVEQMVDVRASLTDMLRNDFRLTSVKKGCEVGECGACNVLIDGECFNSCLYLAVWAEGKHITTLEGLTGPNGELSDIQQAFMDETAIQCGFCIPGFIMTAAEILDRKVYYTDDELRKLLSGHLCRCTGYENIFKAVKKTMLRRLGMLDDPYLNSEMGINKRRPPIWAAFACCLVLFQNADAVHHDLAGQLRHFFRRFLGFVSQLSGPKSTGLCSTAS